MCLSGESNFLGWVRLCCCGVPLKQPHAADEMSAQSDGLTSADFRPSAAECRLLSRDTHLTQFINSYSLNDLGCHDKTPRGAIMIIIIVVVLVVVGTGVGG
jgi:hypothetical protein